MWTHDMREKASKTVIIADMDFEPVSAMLKFIYTGDLETPLDNDELAVSLLKAAHRYEVKALVDLCIDYLCAGLSETLAIERLMVADLLAINALREKCLEFITSSSDRLASVQSTHQFKQLVELRPKLMADILSAAFPATKKGERS